MCVCMCVCGMCTYAVSVIATVMSYCCYDVTVAAVETATRQSANRERRRHESRRGSDYSMIVAQISAYRD